MPDDPNEPIDPNGTIYQIDPKDLEEDDDDGDSSYYYNPDSDQDEG